MRTSLIASTLITMLLTAGSSGAAGLCGDVNDSGAVSASDSLAVLKSAVGQPIGLLCGPPGELSKTGETISRGAGSDGAVQAGLPRSFTDNGNGTITDFNTGLMWEKKDNSGGIHDWENLYSWSTGTSNMDGTITTTFLATLNGGGGFAGHTDWRIPNRLELESLLNFGAANPITHNGFRDACTPGCTLATCSCTIASEYWSSTTSPVPAFAWIVEFEFGTATGATKTENRYARAVRTAPLFETAPTCQAPDPPQCTQNDPCTDGTCSTTRSACSQQSDCALAPHEQCCCAGICL